MLYFFRGSSADDYLEQRECHGGKSHKISRL